MTMEAWNFSEEFFITLKGYDLCEWFFSFKEETLIILPFLEPLKNEDGVFDKMKTEIQIFFNKIKNSIHYN